MGGDVPGPPRGDGVAFSPTGDEFLYPLSLATWLMSSEGELIMCVVYVLP